MNRRTMDLHAVVGEVVRGNPSREGCWRQLVGMGYEPEAFEAVLDRHFEDRRRRAKAKRQADAARGQALIRLLRGEPLPAGIDPGALQDAALGRRIRLHHRKLQGAFWSIAGALGVVLITAMNALWLLLWPHHHFYGLGYYRRRRSPFFHLMGIDVAVMIATAAAIHGWRTARREAADLDEAATRHGWW